MTVDFPDRELRIVRVDCRGSNDYRVDQGPQAVEVLDIRRASDVVRVPALGRDASVEALTHLCDDEVSADGERYIQVEQLSRGV